MLNLFDNNTEMTEILAKSLSDSGSKNKTVVINDDGFLPDYALSPYKYIADNNYSESDRPLYFNEVTIPKYWEIRGNNQYADIYNGFFKKAKILYRESSKQNRMVERVNWFDDENRIFKVDHYNRKGNIFKTSFYSINNMLFKESYYDERGNCRIIEDYNTNKIVCIEGVKEIVFNNKVEFCNYFLSICGFDTREVMFNSLSTPFFLARSTHAKKRILFWQEELHSNIPGNMALMLNEASENDKIFIQNKRVYRKFKKIYSGPNIDKVKYLGYLYDFKKEKEINNMRNLNIFILTNSDRIEHINSFITDMPNLNFHIAALTEMSSKLLSLRKHKNVYLYPNANKDKIDKILKETHLYLDINYGDEVLKILKEVFLNKIPIVTFKDTSHSFDYISDKNVFEITEYEDMLDRVKNILKNNNSYIKAIEDQINSDRVSYSSPEEYRNILANL